MARLDREISAAYYKWTTRVFADLVNGSPQWSGDMTANWNYSVGEPDFSYTQIANKTGDDGKIDHWREDQGVFYAGHPYAVDAAMLRMMAVPVPTWRDKVFISNATPIAEDIQVPGTPAIKIRPVNLVEGQVVTMYTVALKESQRTMV